MQITLKKLTISGDGKTSSTSEEVKIGITIDGIEITTTNAKDYYGKAVGYHLTTDPEPGYLYNVTGEDKNISNSMLGYEFDIIDYQDYNSMYCGVDGNKVFYFWWLASPSASDVNSVCIVNAYAARLEAQGGNSAICPLVSLKSGIYLKVEAQEIK